MLKKVNLKTGGKLDFSDLSDFLDLFHNSDQYFSGSIFFSDSTVSRSKNNFNQTPWVCIEVPQRCVIPKYLLYLQDPQSSGRS